MLYRHQYYIIISSLSLSISIPLIFIISPSSHPGYDFVHLGLGAKWGGFGWRIKVVVAYLKTLPPDEVFVMCDAYDVVFVVSERLIIPPLRCCVSMQHITFTVPYPPITPML